MTSVILGFMAGGAINKGAAVKLSAYTNDAVVVIAATGTTDTVLGIAQETVASGEACSVCVFGETYVKANAAIGFGDQLACVAAAGLVDTAVAGARTFGVCLQAATAQNDLVKALVGVGVGQAT